MILLVTNPLMPLMVPSNMAFGFEQGFQNGAWYANVRGISILGGFPCEDKEIVKLE